MQIPVSYSILVQYALIHHDSQELRNSKTRVRKRPNTSRDVFKARERPGEAAETRKRPLSEGAGVIHKCMPPDQRTTSLQPAPDILVYTSTLASAAVRINLKLQVDEAFSV